jgi:hypothetical protein
VLSDSCVLRDVAFLHRVVVLGPKDLRGAFADDDARGHGVSGGDTGQDRAVGDAKVFGSMDFQVAVHY